MIRLPNGCEAPVPGVTILTAGTRLWRVWTPSGSRGPHTFNPGYGDPTRFAPIPPGAPLGLAIPTLYAGASIEAAICETVLREQPVSGGLVLPASYNQAHLSSIIPDRDINLLEISTPNFRHWGVTRGEMIEAVGANAYNATRHWSEMINRCCPDIQGLVWSSRQFDRHASYMFFGNRMSLDANYDCLEMSRTIGQTLASGFGLTELRRVANHIGAVLGA